MALEGPQLRYARNDETEARGTIDLANALTRALRLAREVEELLEEAPSVAESDAIQRTHSTRMARAMAAGLVDELESLVRGATKSGAA